MNEIEILSILVSIIGLIIAFSIGSMSSSYRLLLNLSKKERKTNLKNWVLMIENYLRCEIKWILSGLLIIFLICMYSVELLKIYDKKMYTLIIFGFVWILAYIIDTYLIQRKQLGDLLAQTKRK